jgi:Uma2 family endonuclease
MSAVPRRLTADEFAAMPHQGLRLELIRGEIVAMAPAFGDHGSTTMQLSILLGQFVLTHKLGRVYAAETGFLLARNPDTVRAPDVAFIQTSRLTAETDSPNWVPVIPDLVGEVVSSIDRKTQVVDKVRTWLTAGVRLVWVAYPSKGIIEVHRPHHPLIALNTSDQLDGYDVVPGFTAPVARVFE